MLSDLDTALEDVVPWLGVVKGSLIFLEERLRQDLLLRHGTGSANAPETLLSCVSLDILLGRGCLLEISIWTAVSF